MRTIGFCVLALRGDDEEVKVVHNVQQHKSGVQKAVFVMFVRHIESCPTVYEERVQKMTYSVCTPIRTVQFRYRSTVDVVKDNF